MIKKEILLLCMLGSVWLNAQQGTINFFDSSTAGINSIGPYDSNQSLRINGEKNVDIVIDEASQYLDGAFNIFNDGPSVNPLFKVTRDGKVGIGTDSPDAALHIAGINGDYLLKLNSHFKIRGDGVAEWGSTSNNGILSWNTNEAIIGGKAGNDLSLRADNSEKIRILTNGNVGIGTSDPEYKLSINGGAISIGDGGSGIPFKIWAGSSGSTNHMRIGTDFGHYGDSALEVYQNYNGGAEQNPGKVIVNGSLGVGVSDPGSYKLAVNGNIHAKEVKVDLTGWPDYVFQSEHRIPTLEEVEKHITEKGHLINIPSAKEVEENGLVLGEMNKLLLEKIEELFLYTIQQEKRLSEMNEKNEKQGKEIEELKMSIEKLRK